MIGTGLAVSAGIWAALASMFGKIAADSFASELSCNSTRKHLVDFLVEHSVKLSIPQCSNVSRFDNISYLKNFTPFSLILFCELFSFYFITG